MEYGLKEVADTLGHVRDVLIMIAEKFDTEHNVDHKMTIYNNAFKIDEIRTNLNIHVECGIDRHVQV